VIAFWILVGIFGYMFISFLSYRIMKQKGVGAEKGYTHYDGGVDYDYSFTVVMAVFWPAAMPIYAMYSLANYVFKQLRIK